MIQFEFILGSTIVHAEKMASPLLVGSMPLATDRIAAVLTYRAQVALGCIVAPNVGRILRYTRPLQIVSFVLAEGQSYLIQFCCRLFGVLRVMMDSRSDASTSARERAGTYAYQRSARASYNLQISQSHLTAPSQFTAHQWISSLQLRRRRSVEFELSMFRLALENRNDERTHPYTE